MSVQILPATAENIEEAARVLRGGGVVAFPTETVYGLAANALDADAVAKIFAAKGRPSTNPIIVHVAGVDEARALSACWPLVAGTLAARFWPGPLTLVVEKADTVPAIVTANGATVGVRVPAHPVALDLLRACGLPLAAPSANRSEEVSPTTAEHVAYSLGPFVDDLLILDGGPCAVGLESTVLDVTATPPRVLRPGMVTPAMLRETIGSDIAESATENSIARAPGQMTRHYAPSKPVILIPPTELQSTMRGADGVLNHSAIFPRYQQCKIIKVHYYHVPESNRGGWRVYFQMPEKPEKYAARLYRGLRELDAESVARIVVELPPDTSEWAAVHDRLRRAAGQPGAASSAPTI